MPNGWYELFAHIFFPLKFTVPSPGPSSQEYDAIVIGVCHHVGFGESWCTVLGLLDPKDPNIPKIALKHEIPLDSSTCVLSQLDCPRVPLEPLHVQSRLGNLCHKH